MPSFTHTYDPTTDVGKVRLLLSDVGGQDGQTFLLADEEITAFLTMRTGVFYAAATAMRTMAANEAMSSKVIQYLDLKTDGEAVADVLNKLADALEQSGDDETVPEIAEIITTPAQYRETLGLNW